MQLKAALFFLFRAKYHFILRMFGSEQLLCLHTLMDFFSDPLLHFQCNLRCLHTGIFFIIHRFHIMDLHSYRLCGTSVKGCITVKQCHRNNPVLSPLWPPLKAPALKGRVSLPFRLLVPSAKIKNFSPAFTRLKLPESPSWTVSYHFYP